MSIVSVAEIHNTTTNGAAALTHATLKAHHTRCIKQNKITCTCIVRSQWRLGWHSRQKRPIEWRSRQPHPIQPTIALIRRTHANVSHMQCPCCSYTTTPRFMHPHPMSKMICTRSHPSSSLLIKVSTTLTLPIHNMMTCTRPPPSPCLLINVSTIFTVSSHSYLNSAAILAKSWFRLCLVGQSSVALVHTMQARSTVLYFCSRCSI